MTDTTAPPQERHFTCSECARIGVESEGDICAVCLGPALPPDAEDERAADLGELERRYREDGGFAISDDEFAWLLAQAREAERLRGQLDDARNERNASMADAQRQHEEAETLRAELRLKQDAATYWKANIDTLESALRPLLGSREPTPENVAEAVDQYVRMWEFFLNNPHIETACGKCLACRVCASEYAEIREMLCADAARSEPEGRE